MAERVDDDKRAQVIAVYAVTGSASKAGRECGVSERSARRICLDARAKNDPLLAEVGQSLRTHAIEDALKIVGSLLETAERRGNDDDWCSQFAGDPGAGYTRSAAECLKQITAAIEATKGVAGSDNDRPDTIEIIAREDEDDDGNDTVTP